MKKNDIPAQEQEEVFSIKSFLTLCLGQWKWILLSLICFLTLGILYIAKKQPVYERFMEILVKDQDSGGGMSGINNAFSDMGLVMSNTKVLNELISFTSPAVMYEVVERLDLTMNYTLKNGFKSQTLYGTNNPIKVNFLDLGKGDVAGFTITLQPNGKYVISKIWKADPGEKPVKFEGTVAGNLSLDSIKTPVGFVAIERNPDYIIPDKKEEMIIKVAKNNLQLTVESYVSDLNGDLTDQDADVINLSIDDTSTERADAILNTIVTVYNERWIEDKNKVAIATTKFIDERLAMIQQELSNVDNEIADYKSDLKVPDFIEMAKGYMTQDFMMNEEIIKLTNLLAMTTFLKEYVENPANANSVIPNSTGTENIVLEEQIGAYNELLLQRNSLSANSSSANPLVKDMDIQLAGARTAIKQSINGNITNLKNTLKNLTAEQSKTKGEMASSPKQATGLLSAERQQQVIQELYLFLLQKREETELTQKFAADNIRVITPPYGPLKPISPKKKLIIIAMIILGVGLPMVIIFINESANTKVRSKKDLEHSVVPFAGELPLIGKKKRIKKYLQSKKKRQAEIDKPLVVVREGQRDIPNEAFRVVRSNIDFMIGKSSGCTIIALTSFNPGSGKSFVAFNLGISFALKHKRVLLIDGDLRHGSLSGYVNSPRKGLTNYLTGAVDDWHSLIVKDQEVPELEVLPIGHRPPNPAELLENGRFESLLEELKNHYDVILVDCPPINIVVDTQLINQYVDKTLFVVRAGVLERSGIKDLDNLYEERRLKNMSVLLNGTSTEFSSYHTYGNYEALENIK